MRGLAAKYIGGTGAQRIARQAGAAKEGWGISILKRFMAIAKQVSAVKA